MTCLPNVVQTYSPASLIFSLNMYNSKLLLSMLRTMYITCYIWLTAQNCTNVSMVSARINTKTLSESSNFSLNLCTKNVFSQIRNRLEERKIVGLGCDNSQKKINLTDKKGR